MFNPSENDLDRAFAKAAKILERYNYGTATALVAMDRGGNIKACTGIDLTFGPEEHELCAKCLAMASAIKHGYHKFLYFAELGHDVADNGYITVADQNQHCHNCADWLTAAQNLDAYEGSGLGKMLEPRVKIFTRPSDLAYCPPTMIRVNDGEYYTPDYGLRNANMHHREKVLSLATDARRFAWSYRGFMVGTGVVAMNERDEPRTFTGVNVKFAEKVGGRKLHKCCGEMLAMANALKHNYRRILTFGVVGPLLHKDPEKNLADTLVPCGECIGLLVAASKIVAYPGKGTIVQPDTMIFSRHPVLHHRSASADVLEGYHSVAELRRLLEHTPKR